MSAVCHYDQDSACSNKDEIKGFPFIRTCLRSCNARSDVIITGKLVSRQKSPANNKNAHLFVDETVVNNNTYQTFKRLPKVVIKDV